YSPPRPSIRRSLLTVVCSSCLSPSHPTSTFPSPYSAMASQRVTNPLSLPLRSHKIFIRCPLLLYLLEMSLQLQKIERVVDRSGSSLTDLLFLLSSHLFIFIRIRLILILSLLILLFFLHFSRLLIRLPVMIR
ncbi:hypothetical protein PENTCL1PPCAC_1523, partial [Pristionchus entomophagus]